MQLTKDEKNGFIFIISGPSGSGKTTICQALLARNSDLYFSVSCTTRLPRIGEQEGQDYYFVDQTSFQSWIEQGKFIEFAEVYGYYYGTLRSEVERYIRQGRDVLLDIDVQGVAQLRIMSRGWLRDRMRFIFVLPPSFAELERRLRCRESETESTIRRRLRIARHEIREKELYDYRIVNRITLTTIKEIEHIRKQEKLSAIEKENLF